MATLSEALAIALRHHQAGRLDLAEEIYRRILVVAPDHPHVWHLLGLIAYHTGRLDDAADSIGRAIALGPANAEYHNSLGLALQAQGNLDGAAACYRRALQLKPGLAEAYNNLANALQGQGKFSDAIPCYRQALQLKPELPDAHNNLGNILQTQGNPEEAIVCYRQALQLRPDYAEAYNNLGNALHARGRLDEAIASYRQALQLKPDYAEAHSNLGRSLHAQGKSDDAVARFHRALQLKPDYAEAHVNLGNALLVRGEFDDAITHYRLALQLKPDYADAHNNFGRACKDLGMVDEAIASYREATRLAPDLAIAWSNYLCALRFHSTVTLRELQAAHAEYDRRWGAPLKQAWRPHENSREVGRVLRLGFVSAGFLFGPGASFLIRALESLRREEIRIICYSNSPSADGTTARFRAASDAWRDACSTSDEDLAAQIRADRIDILFDMAGHSPRNRLLAFARKPAPIQVTWIDSVGTTGLSAIDYLLADRHLVPPEAEPYYAERILRLPDGYVCYEPPSCAPPVRPLPALARGHVRFASFNQPAKIHPGLVGAWASILRRVPGSRLLLKYWGFHNRGAVERYREFFAACGVDAARVEWQGHSRLPEYFDEYNQVDISLDPFPHNGGLTTCDSLWMGVPVVTCPGETFASRQSLSHLSAIGFMETIAASLDQYVEIAVRLASDLPRLAAIRAGLRERIAASPLCDGKRFAANLMDLLRGVWRDWCSHSGAT